MLVRVGTVAGVVDVDGAGRRPGGSSREQQTHAFLDPAGQALDGRF